MPTTRAAFQTHGPTVVLASLGEYNTLSAFAAEVLQIRPLTHQEFLFLTTRWSVVCPPGTP